MTGEQAGKLKSYGRAFILKSILSLRENKNESKAKPERPGFKQKMVCSRVPGLRFWFRFGSSSSKKKIGTGS